MELWFVLMMISVFTLAFVTLIMKQLLKKEHALECMAARSVFTLILLLPLIPFASIYVSWKVLVLIYVISLAITVGILFRIKSLRHMPVSVIGPMMNLSPFFLLVFSYFILGERITVVQLGGVVVLLIGTYLIELRPKHSFFEPIHEFLTSKYLHYLLVTMILFSFIAVTEKFMFNGNYIQPLAYMFFVWFFISLNYLFLEIYRFGVKEIIKDIRNDWKLLLLASFFLVLSNSVYLYALTMKEASIIVPLRRVDSLFIVIFGGRIFHEERILLKVIGCLIMIGGVVLIVL